jgi:predicted lipoprotein
MERYRLVVTSRRAKPNLRVIVASAAALIVLVGMALSTKVVKIDSAAAVKSGAFSEAEFGESEFPKVQSAIEQRAVSAATLAPAIAKDPAAAVKQYGFPAGIGSEIPIQFTGIAGKNDLGTYAVTVSGVPKAVVISVQTGPAILGTDLRDATGTINFGQFRNQIEYQNAGSALNKEMKKEVLSKVDTGNLTGKTISVVGAFSLSDPNNWLVTPVKLDVR